jgi:hypothetical protein
LIKTLCGIHVDVTENWRPCLWVYLQSQDDGCPHMWVSQSVNTSYIFIEPAFKLLVQLSLILIWQCSEYINNTDIALQ